MPPPSLRLHPSDSVAIALRDLAPGEDTGQEGIRALQAIPRGHKVAVCPADPSETILKFGQVIGRALQPIAPGEHVHTHNLGYTPGEASRTPLSRQPVFAGLPAGAPDTFQGILRADGQAGTRNYIGVLSTVNCSAAVARRIADHFRIPERLAPFANVDGVIALTHKSGCTDGEGGLGTTLLRQTLAGYLRHPNFAGVVLVGLGCEDLQLNTLLPAATPAAQPCLHTLTIQEAGGTLAAVRRGVEFIDALLPLANQATRQPLPVSYLKLGLQCGGSDGFSALTANPALGVAADMLVSLGGTAILSETPEVYGAENLLLGRTANGAVSQQMRALLQEWDQYAARHGVTLNDNPAPGNKAGGITTILEKSLGAVAKAGHSPLTAVYRYAERVTENGLVFMDTPGFDPVSVTGQIAGGANLLGFTTGRGSCFGSRPAPCLKLATQTNLYQRMWEDMDINCGRIVDEGLSINTLGAEVYRKLIETASGQRTKSETLGYGEEEFAPWHRGATL